MSASSKIEWTEATWNPVTGCDHVSPGCDNCYAERIATRFGRPFLGAVECHPERLDMPLRWRKPRRVFVNSVSDLFHPDVPDEFIRRVFEVMETAHEHTFQVLTKRPQRMARLVPTFYDIPDDAPIANIWLGVSVENQRYADLRIPHLLATPAAVRFLSVEPLLGAVDLSILPLRVVGNLLTTPRIGWVIVGGESGPGARPMHVQWARDLRDQCVSANVPFFFKQWGEWGWPAHPGDHALTVDGRLFEPGAHLGMDHMCEPTFVRRVGKSRAGRMLDGREWNEYPS